MLRKTAAPREDLTVAQVDDLLTGQSVRRGFGLELYDGSTWIDISEDCQGFTVSRDNTAEVHGRLSVKLARDLAWGQARVRPYRTLSKGGVTAKFYRGVYVLLTPQTDYGVTPLVRTVQGMDILQPLTRYVPDTYTVAAGVTYLQALRDVLTASGIGGTVRLDGTRQDAAIPEARVWALSTGPRWLDVCNDLLAEIGYNDLWVNDIGEYRSEPSRPTSERPSEWTFDTSDPDTDVIGRDRSETYDAWSAPNSWRFVRRGLDYQPFAGNESTPADGIYLVQNLDGGESSVASVGEVWTTHYLDVADQEALESEGDRIVEADRRAERRFTIQTDPLPIAWHRDVVTYRDAGRVYKMQVTSWEESTEGRGTWVLGGGVGGDAPERAESQAEATVVTASPLTVVVDGASTASPAKVLDSATYAIGDRVTVTVRNPRQPLVQGEES